jgi:hypothetical protein
MISSVPWAVNGEEMYNITKNGEGRQEMAAGYQVGDSEARAQTLLFTASLGVVKCVEVCIRPPMYVWEGRACVCENVCLSHAYMFLGKEWRGAFCLLFMGQSLRMAGCLMSNTECRMWVPSVWIDSSCSAHIWRVTSMLAIISGELQIFRGSSSPSYGAEPHASQKHLWFVQHCWNLQCSIEKMLQLHYF